jgi:hypothetical protein
MNVNIFNRLSSFLGIALLSLILVSCKITFGGRSFGYDLKGVRISPECKTAGVDYFKNQASLVQPLLAQKLTEKLKDKILSQTSLKLTNGTGDITFSGIIDGYATEPKAPLGGDNVTAALNRLTVSIKVKYTNSKDPQYEYDTNFSEYIDYRAEQNLDQVENSKDFDNMLDRLVQAIFDRAFVNW